MAIPDFQSLLLPLLRFASDGAEHSLQEAREQLAKDLRISAEDRQIQLTSVRQSVFDNRVSWAKVYLQQARLLDAPRRGIFVISDRGRQVLAENPSRIDLKLLERFPEFVEFRTPRRDRVPGPQPTDSPEPVAPEEPDDDRKYERMLELVRLRYPNWSGFSDPSFVKDEVEYKHRTITKAKELLAESELSRLIRERDFQGCIDRFDKIGKDTNLLWRSVPQQGDLNILYKVAPHAEEFCRAMLDLLYGNGDSSERFGQYIDFVQARELPNKWTFPTFFLFVCHPDSELFVKPDTTKWFMTLMGDPDSFSKQPSASSYRAILAAARALSQGFQQYSPRDMVDIQGLIWACSRAKKEKSQTNALLTTDQTENTTQVAETIAPKVNESSREPYSLKDALDGLFIEPERFEEILSLLKNKMNLIIQGPPGVGKTFFSKRLAYAIMGEKAVDRLGMIQFHQTFAYEDFVQGYRPTGSGFALRDGIFFRFCEKARQDPKHAYVFIIDEINRGNLSKVFGELMMLIEPDKRGTDWAIPVTYGRRPEDTFYVPENLYLIGLMNTADRSLAMVDYALRRRFAFVDLKPGFEAPQFAAYLLERGATVSLVNHIKKKMNELNARISQDTANLGPGYRIGHSFFCTIAPGSIPDQEWYSRVVRTEIEPLLREYWFDDPSQAEALVKDILLAD
jgi:hypothetical protein